jgi:glycosyltransferase involved in cell wall biosynthesis
MSNNVTPTVAVIVSHVNSARTIGRCLQQILDQNYPSNLLHVIVVDGGSTDGSIEVVKQMEPKGVRQILSPGCSEVEGHNIGIRASESDVIMFTNSDIYVPVDWVNKHVEWLAKGYDLVGGRVFWGGDKFAFAWNMPVQKSPKFVQQEGLGLGFSNCSFKRDLFVRVGGLRNLRSQHDTEFAFRVIRMGGRMVLDPEIEVYHDHPFKSFKLSFMRSFGYTLNHVIVMRMSYGRIVSGSGSPALVPVSTLLKEWFLVNGIKVYRELYPKGFKLSIKVGLLEFLLIRAISRELGQLIGAVVGAIQLRVTLHSISDLHGQTESRSNIITATIK